MAKASGHIQPQPASLTLVEIKRGIARLQKRLHEVEQFDPKTLDVSDPRSTVRPLSMSIETALIDTFGKNTIEYNRYSAAATFSWPLVVGVGIDHYEKIRYISDNKTRSLQLLEAAINMLQDRLQELEEDEAAAAPSNHIETLVSQHISRRIFIVHGQDDGTKEAVARFISSIGYDPVILHEQANKGRTIIQKFRDEASDVGFAIVLMTPDDETASGQKRARQNVILELGFFLGALGPDHVAAIVKGDLEKPSDFDGVVYIPFNGSWKMDIAKELQAAGYDLDWNKVMKG